MTFNNSLELDFIGRAKWKKIKENPKAGKDIIYFNESLAIPLQPRKDGAVMFFIGTNGSGKTTTMSLVVSQLPNVLVVDPTHGRFYAETLPTFGIPSDWERRILTDDGKKGLKINAEDLDPRFCIKIYHTKMEKKAYDALNFFFRRPKNRRNYALLKHIFEEEGLSRDFEPFSRLLDHKDCAPPLSDLFKGKWIIETHETSPEEKIFPILLYSLIGAKRKDKENEYLGAFFDESQDWNNPNKPSGPAMSFFAQQGRKYGIIPGYISPFFSGIPPGIRGQVKYAFIHRTVAEQYKQLQKLDITTDDADFLKLPKYSCLLFTKLNIQWNGNVENANNEPIPFLSGDYYKIFREDNSPIIKESNLDESMENHYSIEKFI